MSVAAPRAHTASRSYIALLRGINVGAAKRVSMADLRAVVTGLGFGDVRTLLNSGNVVFTTSRAVGGNVGGRIERALEERTGVWARVTMLTDSELIEIVSANPLGKIATNPSRYMVSVLASPADRKLIVPLLKREWQGEVIALGERVAYFWCPEGITKSTIAPEVARLLRDGVTTRNWATMTKLHAMLHVQSPS